LNKEKEKEKEKEDKSGSQTLIDNLNITALALNLY
jgi:hypothetical protein